MSASTNFQSNITFKGKFDVSEILASIKQMRQQISQTSNIELLGDLDKQISKVEGLGKTIQAQIGKGFSSQKEFSSFQSNINKIELEFEKLGNSFNDINVDNLNKSLKAAEKDIKDLESKAKKAAQTFASSFKASSNNITGADSIKKEIIEAAKQGKSLEETQARIKEIYDNQTRALIEQNKELKQQRETATKNLTNAQGSFANVGLRAANFKNSNGSAVSAVQFTQIRAEFEKIASKSTDAQDAVDKFSKALAKHNIEFKNASTIQGKFTQAISNYGAMVVPAEAALNELNKQIGNNERQISKFSTQQVQMSTALNDEAGRYKSAAEAANAYNTAESALAQTQQKLKENSAQTSNTINTLRGSMNGAIASLREGASATEDSVNSQKKMNSALDELKNRIGYLLSFGNAYYQLRNIIRQTFTDVQKLDKAFASIAMVTDKTVQDLWSTYSDYSEMANRLGQSTESAIKASALFYQQGLDTAEALRLTEDTMKLATLAGADFETATQQMTAALRGFHMEMDQGSRVTDVYSELAANAAADVNGIAYAMSKTASIAANAGMDFETTAAFLTNMIETTQEAPENIGTAMKTIIARFTELKENVSEADSEFDDLDYNKVDKALKSVGISLKDAQGQFRDLDDVFLELSSKWDTLDRNTQRYIATIAAGSRQQSRFIAMMEDYDRTMELVETAQDSAGRSSEQFAKYQDTVEYKINQLKNSWEQLRASLIDSNVFKGAIESLTEFIQNVQNIDLKKLVPLTAIIMPLVQSSASIFFSQIRQQSETFNKVGTTIGEKVSLSFNKTTSKIISKYGLVSSTDLQTVANKLKTQITDKKKEIEEAGRIKLQVENQNTEKLKEYSQALSNIRQNIQETKNKINELKQAEGDHSAEIQNLENRLLGLKDGEQNIINKYNEARASTLSLTLSEKQRENQLKSLQTELYRTEAAQRTMTASSNNVNMALQGVATAATAAFAAIVSGTNGADVMKGVLASLAPMASLLVTNLITMGVQGAIAARGAGLSIGEGFKEGLAAAGPALAIIALAAAIAALGLALFNLYGNIKEHNKDLDEQVEDLEKKIAETESRLNEAKNALENDRSELDKTKKLKEEYEELSKKTLKTTEEQERWKELIAEINTEFPDIVTAYDEANGKLEVQNELWDNIIEKQKIIAEQDAKEVVANAAAKYAQSSALVSKKRQKGYQDIEDNYYTYEDVVEFRNGLLNQDMPKSEFINLMKETFEAENGNFSLADMAATFGYDINNAEDMESFYDDLMNENSSGWETINKEITVARENIEDTCNKEQELIDEERLQTDSQAVSGVTGDSVELSRLIVDSLDKARYVGTTDDIEMSSYLDEAINAFKTMGEESGGGYADWAHLGDDQQEIIKAMYGADYGEEQWNKDRFTFMQNDESFLSSYREAAAQVKMLQDAIDLSGELADDQKESIEEFLATYQDLSEKEIDEQLKDIEELLKDNPSLFAQIQIKADLAKEEIDNLREELASSLDKNKNELLQWSKEELTAYKNYAQQIYDELGTGFGKQYMKEIDELFDSRGLSGSQRNQLLGSVDWSSANANNWEEFKETTIETLKEAGVRGSEEFFNTWSEYSKKYGVLNLTIGNQEELDEYIKKLDETYDKIQTNRDEIAEFSAKATSGQAFNIDDYEKYSKIVEELGLKMDDYLTIDKNGKITANIKNITGLYQQAINKQLDDIDLQIQALSDEKQVRKDLLDAQHDANLAEIEKTSYIEDSVKARKEELAITYKTLAAASEMNGDHESANKYRTQATRTLNEINEDLAESERKREQARKAENDRYYDEISNLGIWEKNAKEQLEKEKLELTKKYNAQVLKYNEENAEKTKEYTDKEAEAQKKIADAQKKVQDALEKIAKAELDVIDKTNELNEALYGDPLHKNKLDPLYNYNTQLEQFTKNASRAKEALEKMQPGDDPKSLINDFLTNTHGELVNRRSQNEVIAASIANYQADLTSRLSAELASMNARYGASMSTNVSDYIYQNENRTGINFQALNAAKLPDSISDYVEETVETINKLQDQIDDNVDEIRKKEQELRDMRKGALDRRKALEDEVIKTLQEKAKEEIDTQKDKYDALKDADNDYLDALEEAIKKERDLRSKANELDDLATKEKKLSLIQRDTSGANEKEVMNLEEEVQNDREKLLNKSIDDILNGMKEMYELQQQSREIEIEYQEAMLENANTIKAATAIIEGWHTSDDLVAWFVENATKEFTEGSETTKEVMITKWQETGDQMVADTELLQTDIMSATEVTQEQITTNIYNTSEMLTSQSQLTLDAVLASTNDAIQKGQQALVDAIASVQAARDEYTQAIAALREAEDAARQAQVDYENSIAVSVVTNDLPYDIMPQAVGGVVSDTSDPKQVYWQRQYNNSTGTARTAIINAMAADDFHIVGNGLVKKYASGGIVDYTGPAWVDGTPSRPEAFLSAEDTQRIGEAAQLLADLPIFSGGNSFNSTSITNGDSLIEVHINIENIASDVDLDNALDKMKSAIWEAANPAGSSVILNK